MSKYLKLRLYMKNKKATQQEAKDMHTHPKGVNLITR